MTGGLLQLVASGKEDIYLTIKPEVTFFKKVYLRHTNFSTELCQIYSDQQANYGQEVTFIIENIGDALNRCYLQIELPVLQFSDTVITNQTYINNKNIMLSTYQTQINTWSVQYTNLKNYLDIEIILYRQLKLLVNTDNITISNFKDQTYQFNNTNKNQKNLYKHKIDQSIFTSIDLSGYIIGITQLIGTIDSLQYIKVTTIGSNIDNIFNSMCKHLKYYFDNMQNYIQLYNKANIQFNINFNWAEYLGHNYFDYFRLEIGGQEIYTYNSDYLHIHQMHSIKEESMSNYLSLIGHKPSLYTFNNNPKGGNNILVPLIYWFNKDAGSSLPLVAMQYQTIVLTAKIKEIHNIISFQNWESMYDQLLTITLQYLYPLNSNIIYNKWNLNTTNQTVVYSCIVLNIALLQLQFPNLTSNDINVIKQYGTTLTIEQFIKQYPSVPKKLALSLANPTIFVITKLQWIHFMNHIINNNTPSNLLVSQKIASYYPFINFNALYSSISLPNISLVGDFVYFDDVERTKFASSKLEYVIENINQNIFDINNQTVFNCELSFTKPVKEIFWYYQPKIFQSPLSEYGQNKQLLFNYSDYFHSHNLVQQNLTLEQLDILLPKVDDNYYYSLLSYKFLNNSLPKGIYYHTFSLYPEETQPSGTANLSVIKSKLYRIQFTQDFINEYYSSPINPNNSNITLKFIAKSYNMFIVEKGNCKLLFTV
jgi:hypothetical protein